MISYNYEYDFHFPDENKLNSWIQLVIESESKTEGDISYVFCSDSYLHKLNKEFLEHDTYTDIISFDYTVGNQISGDIFISIDRVKDNANEFEVSFLEELRRVMVHGILHYCGYKDKVPEDKQLMTRKENEYLLLYPNS